MQGFRVLLFVLFAACHDGTGGRCTCPPIDDPVCASDGVTYANACSALCGGAAITSAGFCRAQAEASPCTVADPVCGSDGVSYPNPCAALAAKVSIVTAGACVDGGTDGGSRPELSPCDPNAHDCARGLACCADCRSASPPPDGAGCGGTICQRPVASLNLPLQCPVVQPTFACGSLTCKSGLEYCYAVLPGAQGFPPSYQCRAIPTTCLLSPSCGCLTTDAGCDLCARDAFGQFAVTCAAP